MHFVLHFLGLGSVSLRPEFEIMSLTIFFYCPHHFLKTANKGGQYLIVIAISEHSVEVILNPAASSFAPEDLEEVVNIKTIQSFT